MHANLVLRFPVSSARIAARRSIKRFRRILMIPTAPTVAVDFQLQVTTSSTPSSDAAWATFVGTSAGACLRASPDNLMAKTVSALGLTVVDGPGGAKDLDWAQLDWLLVRAVDLANGHGLTLIGVDA